MDLNEYFKKAMESEFYKEELKEEPKKEPKEEQKPVFSIMNLIKNTGAMEMSKMAIYKMDGIIKELTKELSEMDTSNKAKYRSDASHAIINCAKEIEVLQIVMACGTLSTLSGGDDSDKNDVLDILIKMHKCV